MSRRWENPEFVTNLKGAIRKANTGRKATRAQRTASSRNITKLNKTYWEEPENKERAVKRQKETIRKQVEADPEFHKKAAAQITKETRVRQGKTTVKYLNEVYWEKPENKKRAAEHTRVLNEQGKMGQQSPNLLESYLDSLLPEDVEFVGNGKWWRRVAGGASMNPDFKVKNANKVIEVYGDYWHRDDDPNERIKLWKSVGVECIVIWEKAIRKNSKAVVDRILKFVDLPMPS